MERQDLETIFERIPSISKSMRVKRRIAQATFCLPQNILGTLFYAALHSTGAVVRVASLNEMTLVVTRAPLGASLGQFIFIGETVQTEFAIRHEYGHTLQGYRHGPFFLLFEGATSFIQASLSLLFPGFAKGYFDRWPENEANRLGGIPSFRYGNQPEESESID